jgi:3-oxoacyl-[acyl-carrier protein] reductase
MEKMLKDRVAIITGSGRGTGRAVALLSGREGAKVVINDIDAHPAQEVAAEIKAALPSRETLRARPSQKTL